MPAHVPAENLAAPVRAAQVDVDHALPVFVGHVEIGARRVDAGAIDQHVDAAELGERGGQQSFDGGALGDVDFQVRRLRAEFLDAFDPHFATLGVSTGHDYAGPGLCDSLGQRTAQHPGSANHDGHLVGESKQLFEVLVGHFR